MREPFRTLFHGYEDHWLLGTYLTGDEPDWQGLAAEERIDSLSTGEKILLGVAGGFTGDRTACIADLGALDNDHRVRVAQAILCCCEDWE